MSEISTATEIALADISGNEYVPIREDAASGLLRLSLNRLKTWFMTAVFAGGTTGQVLTKISGTDFDFGWADSAGGGGSSSPPLYDISAGVPALSGFSNSNFGTGTATAEVAGKAITITAPSGSGTNLQSIYKGVPATPYRVAMYISELNPGNDSWLQAGWRSSANSHYQGLIVNKNGGNLVVQDFSAPGTFVAQHNSITNYTIPPTFWVGFRDDGTNVYFEFSLDSVEWQTIYSVAKASGYLGSTGYDRLFFGLRQNNGNNAKATLRVWDEAGLTRAYP